MAVPSTHCSDPLTLELADSAPRPNPTRGEPVESVTVLFEDAHIEAGVWECTPGAFRAVRDGYREQFTVIAGRAVLRGDDGVDIDLAPGVTVVTPEGWAGEWDIAETTRKIYVVSYTEPRA